MAKNDDLPLWPAQTPTTNGVGDVFHLPERELDELAASLAKRHEPYAVVLLPTLRTVNGGLSKAPDCFDAEGGPVDVICGDERTKRAFIRAMQAATHARLQQPRSADAAES